MKYRYFPFLGVKTLTDEEALVYEFPLSYSYKGLVFEWLGMALWIIGKATLKKDTNAS